MSARTTGSEDQPGGFFIPFWPLKKGYERLWACRAHPPWKSEPKAEDNVFFLLPKMIKHPSSRTWSGICYSHYVYDHQICFIFFLAMCLNHWFFLIKGLPWLERTTLRKYGFLFFFSFVLFLLGFWIADCTDYHGFYGFRCGFLKGFGAKMFF